MREHDSFMLGGPSENLRIFLSGQTDVLNSHEVKVRPATQQPTNYVTVEVLVRQQSQHDQASCGSESEQAIADFTQVTLLFLDTLANFVGQCLTTYQIGVHFLPMTQVVGDDCVHVGQCQR
jgi:hypothetical protein